MSHAARDFAPTRVGIQFVSRWWTPVFAEWRLQRLAKLQLAQTSAESSREDEEINKAENHPDCTQLEREPRKIQPNVEANAKAQRREHQIPQKVGAAAVVPPEEVMEEQR